MNAFLVGLVVGEWAVTAVLAGIFLLVYGPPWRYEDKTMAWHITAVTAVTALESAGLFLVGIGVALPIWIFAVVYGVATAIVYWRLWLLIRTRRPAE